MSHKCYICYSDSIVDDQHYHPACSKRVFGTEEPPEVPYSLNEMKELARQILQVRGAVTGVQPKISLGFDRTQKERRRLTIMTGEFILKPPSENYSQMPENEDLTMHLAQIAKIKVVPHALIPLATGELAYITKRIDRTTKGKVHMEDFHQLMGIADKYGSSMERVGRIIKQYSFFSSIDLITAFELLLFCFVTGNADMHLKNFSLIKYKDRGFWLADAYDLLNTNVLLPEDREESALTINGKRARLKLKDFQAVAISYGLDQIQFETAIKNILAKEKSFSDWINMSFLDPDNKEKYESLLMNRLSRLKHT